jgi:hypothetical protein
VADNTAPGRTIRVYAFCTRTNGPIPYASGAITVAAININNATVSFELNVNGVVEYERDEYHLTAPNGDMASTTVLLNGTPLQASESGQLPAFTPVTVTSNTPVTLAPLSFGFFVLTNAKGATCL